MQDWHKGLPRLVADGLVGKPRYWGTVDPETKRARRAKNKRARKARRSSR